MTTASRDLRTLAALAARFGLAGMINTAIGMSITLVLDVALGVAPALANAAGYAVGILVSWILQRRFVFRSRDAGWAAKTRYVTTIALAFAVNQAVLWAMPLLVGDSRPARVASQVVAMASYTVVQFILFRLWVFRATPGATPEAA